MMFCTRIRTLLLFCTFAWVVPQRASADMFTRLRTDLARAAPSQAARIRSIAVPTHPDTMPEGHFGALGLAHPETRRPVCDFEAVGVIAIDQAVRVLFRKALSALHLNQEAALLAAVPAVHDGTAAAVHARVLRTVSRSLREHGPAASRVPLARAALGLHWGLGALGRHRGAPESFVLEKSIEAARAVSQVLGAAGDVLVAEYAETIFRAFHPADGLAPCR